MKNTNLFLSNEPYSILRTQKFMNVKVFKAHTAKNNGFPKNFCSSKKKNTRVLSKIGYLESLAQPVLVRNVSNAL